MTALAPEMEALAMRMSFPLRLQNPMRFVAEGPDFIRGLAKTVDEATTLQQEGKVVEGFALEAWAALLLAAGIGYDGYIVSAMGEDVAGFLRQPRADRSREGLVRIGNELGIYKPYTYLNHNQLKAVPGVLWGLSYDELRHGHRPNAMRRGFWAVCIRESELDLAATRVPAGVSKADLIYRAFASGSRGVTSRRLAQLASRGGPFAVTSRVGSRLFRGINDPGRYRTGQPQVDREPVALYSWVLSQVRPAGLG